MITPVSDGEIAVFDRSYAHAAWSPSDEPTRCTLVPLQGAATDIWVADDRIFVAERLFGIEVFDRRRLLDGPLSFHRLPLVDATAVAVWNDMIVLGLGSRGLALHDLDGDAIGRRIGTWETPGEVRDLDVTGGVLLVADGSSLRIVAPEFAP